MMNFSELDMGPKILEATAQGTKSDYVEDQPFRKPSFRNRLFGKSVLNLQSAGTGLSLTPSILTAGIMVGDFADRRLGAALASSRSIPLQDAEYLLLAQELTHNWMGAIYVMQSINGLSKLPQIYRILGEKFNSNREEILEYLNGLNPVAGTLKRGIADEALIDLAAAAQLANQTNPARAALTSPITSTIFGLYRDIYPHSASFLQNR